MDPDLVLFALTLLPRRVAKTCCCYLCSQVPRPIVVVCAEKREVTGLASGPVRVQQHTAECTAVYLWCTYPGPHPPIFIQRTQRFRRMHVVGVSESPRCQKCPQAFSTWTTVEWKMHCVFLTTGISDSPTTFRYTGQEPWAS